jgi:hypothetical protein
LVSPPVEVAYAPPSDNDGAFDPPPGWKPTGMSKGEVAAYVPPPSAPPAVSSQPSISPQPAALAYAASSAAEPPHSHTPAPAATLAAQYAALPEPPAYIPSAPAPTVQTAAAYGYAPAPAGHREQGFRLVAPAMAAPAPVYRGASPGQWAIQVGAFGNEGLAHIAVGNAREQAGAVLAGARPAVAGVREPHGTLYRARLTGLSRDAATQACERLRGRTNCIVLSPDAQS